MTQPAGPLISVVMPSYNHARFIGGAVASVLAQTYHNLELIVVDNNSTDGTAEALAAFQDPRLRTVQLSNNGIIAASRNLGIRLAAGEYVAFIDSDDAWLPEKLQVQLEALKAGAPAALAYCRFRTVTGEAVSERVFPRPDLCAGGAIFNRLYLHTFVACSGVLVKKTVLDRENGFSEEPALVAVEDMDLWLRSRSARRRSVLPNGRSSFTGCTRPGCRAAGAGNTGGRSDWPRGTCPAPARTGSCWRPCWAWSPCCAGPAVPPPRGRG